jgi:FtsP/CotA-like multicopper oxidase with cupredoxin domain
LSIKGLIITALLFLSIQCQYTGPALGPQTYFYSGEQLKQPVVVSSKDGFFNLTLEVDIYRHNSFISFTTRAFYYNGSPMIPGPTWKVKPGDKVNINLVNKLTGAALTSAQEMTYMNYMHGVNTTNIHTHGLHVDPEADTIFKYANPGTTLSYSYTIPSDHAPGMHWYHSHKHGVSALQVMGGLYGAIFVEPKDSSAIPAELSTWESVTLCLSHFSTNTTNTYTDPFTIRSIYNIIALTSDENVSLKETYVDNTYRDIYFTNGQFQPYYTMTANTNVIFDIVNSSGDHTLELEIRTAIGASGAKACTMTALAVDGVYFKAARPVTFLVVVPSQRSRVVISCSSAGTFYLQSYADLNTRGGVADTEARFNQNLLTLKVTAGTATSPAAIPNLGTITRPAYLTDLMSSSTSISSSWQISIEQPKDRMWLGVGENCTLTSFGRATDPNATDDWMNNPGCGYVVFPGSQGTTGTYRHTGIVNTNEELVIWGRGKTPHVMHIHVNHFQIISVTSDAPPSGPSTDDIYTQYYGQLGDWRDTVPAFPGKTVIRYKLDTFRGEIVIHCHFLFHEDIGMMATFYSGDTACNYPKNCTVTAAKKDSGNSSSGAFNSVSLLVAFLATIFIFI